MLFPKFGQFTISPIDFSSSYYTLPLSRSQSLWLPPPPRCFRKALIRLLNNPANWPYNQPSFRPRFAWEKSEWITRSFHGFMSEKKDEKRKFPKPKKGWMASSGAFIPPPTRRRERCEIWPWKRPSLGLRVSLAHDFETTSGEKSLSRLRRSNCNGDRQSWANGSFK